MRKRCLAALAALALWYIPANAQQGPGPYSYTFINTGTNGPSGTFANTGITSFSLNWTPQSSVLTCAVQVDSSADGVTWGSGDLIASQPCTVNGFVAATSLASGKNFVRVHVTTLTGNGGLNVVLTGQIGGGSGGGSPSPNIKLVQTPGTFTSFTTSTTGSQAFNSANIAGDLGIAFVYVSTAAIPTSVTDTAGNTWFQAGQSDVIVSTIYYCPSLKAASSNTVTANFAASASGAISVAEYSGILSAHPVLNAVAPNGSNSQPQGFINVTVPGSLLVMMTGNNGITNGYSNFVGCTLRTPGTAALAIWCDNTNTIAGFNAWSFTQSGAGAPDFISKAVTFLPATYTVPANPFLLRQSEGAAGSSGGIKISSSSPLTDEFPGGNQSGNTIVLFTQQNGNTDFITSVSDTNGNTYTRLVGGGDIADSGAHKFYSIYTAPISSTTQATNTISVAFSSGTLGLAAVEVSGITGTKDASAQGLGAYTLTTSAPNEIVFTSAGLGGGSAAVTGFSGTDIFGGNNNVAASFIVTSFLSCVKNNPITPGFSPTNTLASFSVAMTPTAATSGSCPTTNASSLLGTSGPPSSSLWGNCSGVATASQTLGFFNLGQTAALTCTSTVTTLGVTLTQNTTIQGIFVIASAGGVNASSGVVTLLKNGSAFPASITCTMGTANNCNDMAHPQLAVAGDVISAQFTTQVAETLANLKIQVTKTP